MKTCTIHVLQEHINRGRRRNCSFCPVALALADACGGTPSVGLRSGRARIPGTHALRDFALPWKVQDFIRSFDAHIEVFPFSFEVEL